jgi:hypothetical protein
VSSGRMRQLPQPLRLWFHLKRSRIGRALARPAEHVAATRLTGAVA